eukprot:2552506-Pleurochrysis_carterae.AAC.4
MFCLHARTHAHTLEERTHTQRHSRSHSVCCRSHRVERRAGTPTTSLQCLNSLLSASPLSTRAISCFGLVTVVCGQQGRSDALTVIPQEESVWPRLKLCCAYGPVLTARTRIRFSRP